MNQMVAQKLKRNYRKIISLLRCMPQLISLSESSDQLLKLARVSEDSLLAVLANNATTYKQINSIEDFLAELNLDFNDNKPCTASLDLGCGSSPRNPFQAAELCGVDIREDLDHKIKCANLACQDIPYSNNSFDYCTAFDFIEHMPRILSTHDGQSTRFPFVELMNEIWRILKPGGLFLHQTPAFPCKQAFQDPTHVNLITEDTIPYYFCEPHSYATRIGYGFTGKFEYVGQAWLNTAWIVGVLRAVK